MSRISLRKRKLLHDYLDSVDRKQKEAEATVKAPPETPRYTFKLIPFIRPKQA